MTLTPLFEAFLIRTASRLDPIDSAGTPAPAGPLPAAEKGAATHAAVALLLRPDRTGDSAEILLIKRAERDGDPWSGHMAFPGGRAEARDATLLDVAVRETVEEVGIDVRNGGRLLGWLPSLRPLSARNPLLSVAPLVALAPGGAIPHLQASEVETAFWMSLAALRVEGQSARVRHEIEGVSREWPAYPSPQGPIWGITARILSRFIELTGDSTAQ
jgi:8-oxo-dGTP pyrophosphatase MutT (NUDIX family)